MNTYFIVFFILIICWYLYSQPKHNFRLQNFSFWFGVIVLLVVAGFRYRVGTDYDSYMYNYDWLYTRGDISITNQPSLYIIAKVSEIIEHNSAIWFFIMSVITIIPVAYVIKKYSIDAGLSLLFFVLIGSWHFSFNIVKQSAAMSILFLGYKYLYNRDFKHWITICLIACTFHISALFMIPIYFVVDTKVDKKKIFICVIVAIILSLSYEYLLNIIAQLKTSGNISEYSKDVINSVNPLRIAVNCTPVIFIVLFLKRFDFNDNNFVLCFYLSILNVLLNLVSYNSIYLNRIVSYTNIYNVLLIPYLVKPFPKKTRYFFCIILITCYFIFWSYDLYKGEYTRNYNWIF